MLLLAGPDEGRATTTTNAVMAAVERFIGWVLFGPRLHDGDLRWSLGPVSSANVSETTVKRS